MFAQPIVFVVGAGASAEYGMPTGAALVRKIASIVKFDSTRRDNPNLINLFLDRLDVYQPAGLKLSNFIKSGVPRLTMRSRGFLLVQRLLSLARPP
ncbi:MAG TPA: hypothetical protein VKP67_12745 [Xanthobacteraceae bacterium]|nr:hypothetical protein [Xanthobacteraceae bacterium]